MSKKSRYPRTEKAELWDITDLYYFTANPSRSFRLRRLMPNEAPHGCRRGTSHTVIKKLSPASFRRRYIGDDNGGADWDAMPDSNSIAQASWEALEASEDFLLEEIHVRAAAIEHGAFCIKVLP